MEEDNSIKELFMQKRYDEVIASLEKIFRKLFIHMLDYKKEEVKEDYKDKDYDYLALLVATYYPRYRHDILNLTHASFREDNTYLDVINIMLSIYSYFSDTYKNDDEPEYDYIVEDVYADNEEEDNYEDEEY